MFHTVLGEMMLFEGLSNWEHRQCERADFDSLIFGQGFIKTTERSIFNPMRYMRGVMKYERIDPRKIHYMRKKNQ